MTPALPGSMAHHQALSTMGSVEESCGFAQHTISWASFFLSSMGTSRDDLLHPVNTLGNAVSRANDKHTLPSYQGHQTPQIKNQDTRLNVKGFLGILGALWPKKMTPRFGDLAQGLQGKDGRVLGLEWKMLGPEVC